MNLLATLTGEQRENNDVPLIVIEALIHSRYTGSTSISSTQFYHLQLKDMPKRYILCAHIHRLYAVVHEIASRRKTKRGMQQPNITY